MEHGAFMQIEFKLFVDNPTDERIYFVANLSGTMAERIKKQWPSTVRYDRYWFSRMLPMTVKLPVNTITGREGIENDSLKVHPEIKNVSSIQLTEMVLTLSIWHNDQRNIDDFIYLFSQMKRFVLFT